MGINAIEKRRAKEHNTVEVVRQDDPSRFEKKGGYKGKQAQGPGMTRRQK